MQLIELINITDELFYNNSPAYKVIASKQKELLSFTKESTNINKIDDKFIINYIKFLKDKNNSNATINAKLSYLSKLLNYAHRTGKLKYKPYIPFQTIIENKTKFLTKEDKIKMLQWCRRNHQKELAKIILLGIYTGLRINNIITIFDSIYKDDCLYVYDKKVNKNFVIPVKSKIKYIITNNKPFKISYNQCYYLFNLMKKDLNLDKDITIHTLRHTFCSDLLQENVSLPVIQALANHKKITTTMRYTHYNINQLKEAINCL